MRVAKLVYLAFPLVCIVASGFAGRVLGPAPTVAADDKNVTTLTPAWTPGFAPRGQEQTTRTWFHWQPTISQSFRIPRASAPTRLIVSANSIYVLSHADQTICKYSLDGHLIHRYTVAADETSPIADFALTGTGLLWASDPNGRTVAVDNDGHLVDELPTDIHAMTMAAIGEALVIAPVASPALKYGDALLLLVERGQSPQRLPSFIQDHPRMGSAVTGIPVASPNGDAFYYVTRFAGLLNAYTPTGRQVYGVHTISNVGLPVLQLTRQGAIRVPFSNPEYVRGIAATERFVLTLSDVRSTDPSERDPSSVVDTYDRHTGAYVGSWSLPFRCTAVGVRGDQLFGASNNDVTVWPLPRELTR